MLALAAGLYAPTADHAFLDWDDTALVVENPFIRELSLRNLIGIARTPLLDSYFPLQSVSYAIDHAIWGLDPFGFHLHALLLNAVNGVLAFWLLWRLARRPEVAFVAALLFAAHHSHVSSVAWVSARKELLFATFLLLSTGFYLRARRDGGLRGGAYAASVALFGLGAAAKATIAVYPLFFLLLDRVLDADLPAQRRRSLVLHVASKLPFVAVTLPFLWANLQVQMVSDAAAASDAGAYLLLKGHAAWRYLGVLAGVLPGQPLYDPPAGDPGSLAVVARAAALLVPPVLLALALWRGHREAALALAWLLVGLVPPLVFPLTTYMADRYLYVPSLGFCWLLALALAALARRVTAPGPARALTLAALTALPLLLFAHHVRSYTPAWRDSESLWRHATAYSHDGRAAAGLAAALIREDRLDEAERVLDEAPVLGANGYLHLAIIHMKRGEVDAAWEATERAMRASRAQPSRPEAHARLLWMRAAILGQRGRLEPAERALEEALRLDPGNRAARDLLEQVRRARARP